MESPLNGSAALEEPLVEDLSAASQGALLLATLIGISIVLYFGGGRPKKAPVPQAYRCKNYFNPSLPVDQVIRLSQPGKNKVGRPRSCAAEVPRASNVADTTTIDLEVGQGKVQRMARFEPLSYCRRQFAAF